MIDNRPKPSKQKMKFYMGLSDKLIALSEEEGKFFFLERPWMEDPTYPKPWTPLVNPEWEEEKKLLKKKMVKVSEEIDKLFIEMYPPSIYPEMHGQQEQPALIEGVEPVYHNTPKPEVKTVENMSMSELEGIFGARSKPPEIVATTAAGAAILKQFEEQRNRRKGY